MKNDKEKSITDEIVEKLCSEENKNNEEMNEAQRALTNYLTVLFKGTKQPAVKRLFSFFNVNQKFIPLTSKSGLPMERSAILNGFAAHYLDLDDTQANLRGHPGATIFSTLFAVTAEEDSVESLLWAYVQGVELAGKFGKILNPQLAWHGWHTTGLIGTIAAAAAIGVYKKFDKQQLINLLSFAATQASGLEIEAGSDGKPFNAGIAARNAITAYLFVKSGLTANQDPFGSNRGWFEVVQGRMISAPDIVQGWLNPAEIIEPGLWFKAHPFCSAAMSSLDAAKELYRKGVRLPDCQRIVIHFPVEGDHALRFENPQNGKEGKFSAEYIVWQVLTFGDVKDDYFELANVPDDFNERKVLFTRKHDLLKEIEEARPTKIDVLLKNGSSLSSEIIFPKGSPKNKVSTKELIYQLNKETGQRSEIIKNIILNPQAKAIKINLTVNRGNQL
ncbi:MmgE/PrpD family protein [Liquorilactobacillus sicerae]|uniref:MmgE/PrpD family protein n=1 Tax=Liquorilactobacillus sicerae TaxID=1416943 RepID=UPI00247FAFEC|nr:MmgE/PrpD family protein [Liquorilactobacillus sicerae]